MSRLSSVRLQAVALVAAGGMACLCAAVPALAGKPPLVLSPTFVERTPDAAPQAAAACTVAFTTVTDERRDPVTVGVFDKRSIRAPQDTQAWMRAIVGGLARRGVTPVFELPSAEAPAGSNAIPTASFKMQTVWLAGLAVDIAANVIVTVDATGAGGQTLHQTYRGRKVKMNWASGDSELESTMTEAFGDALDKMAPDLQRLCTPPAPAAS